MSLCVAGLYAGPWFVGSVFEASRERSVPCGISAVMCERYVPSASSRLSLFLFFLLVLLSENGDRVSCYFFYLFRNSEGAIRGHQFIAVSDIVICLALYFLRKHK